MLVAMQVTILACPQILMSGSQRSGSVIIYHDNPGDSEDMSVLARRVAYRLQAGGFLDSTQTVRAYVFYNSKMFALVARLALLGRVPQGFNLSVFGNSFVNVRRSRELSNLSSGYPRYSIYDGDLSHLIAHEIAHQLLIDRIGRTRWRKLPFWKQEGIPEYIANIALLRADSSAHLAQRLEILRDDSAWRLSHPGGTMSWDRIHYEAGLMVEFLLEECDYTLEDVLADSTDGDSVRQRLLGWFQ